MDNVVIDNIGPQAVSAEFIDLTLGPGDVNFMPEGVGVNVTNNIKGSSRPKRCVFPELPAPELPENWLR
jgi:hypothetical protein